MILGTGIDIIEILRIQKISKNDHFMNRFFTDNEREYFKTKKIQSIAGYFCAKEATAKALGTGFSGFNFKDIEIIKKGAVPSVILHNNALKIAQAKGIKEIHLSISHCNEYATAFVVAES